MRVKPGKDASPQEKSDWYAGYADECHVKAKANGGAAKTKWNSAAKQAEAMETYYGSKAASQVRS
jgi:hypothetical protein